MTKPISPQNDLLRSARYSASPAVQEKKTPFHDLLKEAAKQDAAPSIAFSKHAMIRAEQRGIEIDDTLMTQLSDSVEKAQAKGAKNILAFDATRAFIVNVPNYRVITAMSQEEMKENVFTNIDGAVIL